MGSPRRMVNPISIASLGLVSAIRGGVYIATAWVTLSGADVGPVFPFFPTPAMGVVWLLTGLFVLASMWRWKWFRLAMSLQAAMYFTWALTSIMDLMVTPDWVSIISMAVYGALVPISVTLARIETAPRPAEVLAGTGAATETC